MSAYITKWGNSFGVRIPRAMAKQMGITEGTAIMLIYKHDKIIIEKKHYKLEQLLKQIKPSNLHEEISCGEPVGKEKWE
jgi:antitoxin MazE